MSGGKADVMQIACAFAEEYYKTIATSYLASLPFYGPIARVCVGGSVSPVTAQTFEGKSTITLHLQHLDQTFSPRKLVIVNLDAVSAPNSVVVTVAGKILMPNVDRTFNQVFLLANQHGHDTYYIAAEVLRFTEEVKHEPRHAPASAAPVAPRANAAPVHTATSNAAPHGSHATHAAQAHPHAAPAAVLPSPTQKVPVFEENDEDERRKTPPPPAVPAPRRRQEELKAESKKPHTEPPKPKSAEARTEEKSTKSEPKRSSNENKEKPAEASAPAKETKKEAPQPKTEKSAAPANKKVVLFNVPDGATVKDVEYYTEPFGKIESISWMSSRHTIVEFKYLEDAKSLVAYDQFTMFRKPVRRDFFREDKAAAPREAPKKEKTAPKPRSQEKAN